MTQAELLALGTWSAIAFVVAVLSTMGFAIMLSVERVLGRWVPLLVVPAMGLGTAISSALSGRDLKYAFAHIEAISQAPSEGSSFQRIISLAIVGLCSATIVAKMFSKNKLSGVDRPGTALFAWFMAFYVCNSLLNGALGTQASFSHNILYLPLVFAAVYLWRDGPLDLFVRYVRWMLIAFMLGSLLLAVAKPGLAVQTGYLGWVPGLSIRLWGLGSHPNSLGPLALELLLLEWLQPSRNRLFNWFVWLVSIIVLVLAQSKTVWLAAFVVVGVLASYRWARAPRGGMRIGFVLACIAGLLVLTFGLIAMDPVRIWERVAGSQIGNEITTLTGRAQIWGAAIDAWRDNPGFGYGPEAWGPAHRLAIGMPFAFSAHNQFLQSLSSAGIFGLVSLVGYVIVLAACCWRGAPANRGVALALLVLVLLRCLSEIPLSASTLFNGDVITHLVLFRFALLGGKPSRRTTVVKYREQAKFGNFER